MESLPPELVGFIELLRPLFRAEVFTSFCYLMTGILIGEAKYGTVRVSVFADADYRPQRLSDLFCRHRDYETKPLSSSLHPTRLQQ